MTEGTLELAGDRFHFLSRGDPRAPLVLCLHGFPDHAPSFVPMLDALADAGWFAVAPWMRGYAPSTLRGPFHAERLGADAIALADALSPDRPARIVGHDWGAIATYIALARAPQRWEAAVVMSVPHPLHWVRELRRRPAQAARSSYIALFQVPALPERLIRWRRGAAVDWLWRLWSPGYRLPTADRAALIECLRASLPAPIDYYRAVMRPPREARARLRDATTALRHIRVPTLYLHGADDGCVRPAFARGQARWFAAEYDEAIVSDAGHFLHVERPAEVARRVDAWLITHRTDR